MFDEARFADAQVWAPYNRRVVDPAGQFRPVAEPGNMDWPDDWVAYVVGLR
jgi:hypothetical protein